MATLFLMCGLPGAGKTTMARQLERDRPALRLTPDEWIAAILKDPADTDELDRRRRRRFPCKLAHPIAPR